MKFLFILLLVCSFATSLFSQSDSTLVTISFKNGFSFSGHLIQQDSASVRFETLDHIKMVIPREVIGQIRYPQKNTKQTYSFKDPNSTRLFFAPTSRTLKRGKGYVADYWVFFPFVAVGALDQLILSGGITLVPGAEDQIVYLAPKVGLFQNDSFGVASGILYINTTSMDEQGLGIVYAVSTFGGSEFSATLGTGWSYSGESIEHEPIILVGGEARVSKSIKLISENWFIPNNDFSLLSFGVRFFGRELAADVALIYPLFIEMKSGFPFIPWLGFAYNF